MLSILLVLVCSFSILLLLFRDTGFTTTDNVAPTTAAAVSPVTSSSPRKELSEEEPKKGFYYLNLLSCLQWPTQRAEVVSLFFYFLASREFHDLVTVKIW